MKIIVIGGGASGLTSAIIASKNNDVTILEKNNNLGKKILVTGNGKCNYFNDDFNSKHFLSNTNIDNLINTNIDKIKDYFNLLGIVPRIKDGYYYPLSNQAISIQNTLISEVNKRNIKVITNTIVTNITKTNDIFTVLTNNGTYTCDKVIYATGSNALYNTDVELNNYNILKNLGHTIIDIKPGLTKLKTNKNFKDISGVRTDVNIKLYVNNKYVKEEVGELQFNDNSISGICAMQLSNIANRNINNSYVEINFLNNLNINTYEEFNNYFSKRNNLLNKNISLLFDTILNYKLSNYILKISNINLDSYYNKIDSNRLKDLYNNLVKFKVDITSLSDYKEAQITTGGISLNDIDLDTMESKIVKGLYITGEILDISGDCGGYNLGFAFLSGILAGESNIC